MGDTFKDTKNVKFVAYLRFKGIFPDRVEKISRGKARYFFNLSDNEWLNLKLKFDKSPEFQYAQCLDAVVDLAH